MSRIWKVGSRWDDYGSTEAKIISIFRRSGVVFVGSKNAERFRDEVKKDDYIAIADGFKIMSVAKVISETMSLNDMIKDNLIKMRGDEPFNLNWDYTGCYGVRVKIVDLPENKIFEYKKMGAFFEANSIKDIVVQSYNDNLKSNFNITAKTYRIKNTRKNINGLGNDKEDIINGSVIYTIPIYQREYSWESEQIEKLLFDLVRGFNNEREPLFIGTMQFSYKKYITKYETEQDIIDGQQRISTILCLLKYLQLSYPDNEIVKSIELNWLESRVNNGKEDSLLNTMLRLSVESLHELKNKEYTGNHYIFALDIINDFFERYKENIKDNNENNQKDVFLNLLLNNKIDSFLDYLLNDVWFVVVETVAGLSKTIQIFNTINTLGLDLTGSDIFKVQLYEYLRDYKNASENAFNEINGIYEQVKELNTEWKKKENHSDIISMDFVRYVYKDYLISKYNLPVSLYAMATDTFFEGVFDALLNVQIREGFESIKNTSIDLSIDDLKKIVTVIYFWNAYNLESYSNEYKRKEEFIIVNLIQHSRYARYGDIVYQIMLSYLQTESEYYVFSENKEKVNEALLSSLPDVYNCLKILSKMFFCWSLYYARSVYEIHSCMYEIYRDSFEFIKNKEKIFNKIKVKLCPQQDIEDFKQNTLGKEIVSNRTWKDLMCLLSASLDELKYNTNPLAILKQILSWSYYDIEHIHATANKNECKEIDENLQNSIGNLVLLERSINREIKAIEFEKKCNSYSKSKYESIKLISKNNQWTISDIEQRKKSEIEKLSKFLFSDLT